MVLKRNTQVGKNNFKLIYLIFLFYFCLVLNLNAKSNLEGTFTDIKILDKISSKNTLLKLKNGKLIIEIGSDQKYKMINILKKNKFYINKITKDLSNLDRCITSTKIA